MNKLQRVWQALTSTQDAPTGQPAPPVIASCSVDVFHLRGCRELLEQYADSLQIQSAIEVIEGSIPDNPGVAFTHCRGLLETVCRTILADRGVETDANPKPSWLMSQTLRVLKLTPETFDGDNAVEDGVGDVLGGMNRLMLGVVALRKSQGVGPHGRDALEAVLDADYAVITANAVDAAAALLYRLHRKQTESDPLKRMRFGDYPDFDNRLDDRNPDISVEEIPLQASRALYMLEFDEYQQKLRVFLDERPTADEDLGFEAGEMISEGADE